MGVNQRLLLDLEDPFPPQVSDYERCAGERDADADGGEGLVDGVGDDEGGRAGAQLARRRQLLPHVGHRAQQAHYVEAAARKESVRLREVSSCSFFTVMPGGLSEYCHSPGYCQDFFSVLYLHFLF